MTQLSNYDQRPYQKRRKTGRRRAYAQNAFKLKILAGISKKHVVEQNTWVNERHGVLHDYEPLQSLTTSTPAEYRRFTNRVFVTGTQLRRVIRLPTTAAPTSTSWVRILCCIDKQPTETWTDDFFDGGDTGDNTVAANFAQSSGVTNNNNANRLNKPINRRRYEVLYDQVFKLALQQNTGSNLLLDANSERIIQTPYIPINRVIGFDANTSGSTNPSPNIHWFHFYENAADSNLVFHDNKYIYHTYFKDL